MPDPANAKALCQILNGWPYSCIPPEYRDFFRSVLPYVSDDIDDYNKQIIESAAEKIKFVPLASVIGSCCTHALLAIAGNKRICHYNVDVYPQKKPPVQIRLNIRGMKRVEGVWEPWPKLFLRRKYEGDTLFEVIDKAVKDPDLQSGYQHWTRMPKEQQHEIVPMSQEEKHRVYHLDLE